VNYVNQIVNIYQQVGLLRILVLKLIIPVVNGNLLSKIQVSANMVLLKCMVLIP